MKYKSRIFRKYVVVSALVITGSVLILGLFLVSYMNSYWYQERSSTLRTSSQNVANLASTNLMYGTNGMYLANTDAIGTFMSMFARSCDADIILADTSGNIIVHSDNIFILSDTIPKDALKPWTQHGGKPFFTETTLGGLYSDIRLVSGYPVTLSSFPNNKKTVAIAFSVARTQYFDLFVNDAIKGSIFLTIVIFFISYFGLLFLTYRTYKPLKEIARVVNGFKKGNFDNRVNIKRNDEIGDLANSFNDMAENLARSEDTRRNFIANVSHELKTPMTTIAGFIDGIIDGTIPKERQDYYLAIVSEEVKRLSRLVKTMLDLSHIDNGEFTINKEQLNITEMIMKVMISFEAQINEKHIEIYGLDKLSDSFISGDYDIMYRVIYNLVENAVKFTNDGGYIEVNIRSKNVVTVQIKNSGMGISKADIPMIFDKFYKTDKSRSKDKKGMGLGLYIVKKMINLHGGDIKIDSVEHEYCCFTFWLPKK